MKVCQRLTGLIQQCVRQLMRLTDAAYDFQVLFDLIIMRLGVCGACW